EVVGGGRTGARGHSRDWHLAEDLARVQSSLLYRSVRTRAALGALPDRGRAVDEGDAPVPEAEQVGDRDLPAAPVIDGDRALRGRARPVEQDHRGAAVTDPPQLGRAAVHRGDE